MFPAIPDALPAQAADEIGRAPAFDFDAPDSAKGAFVLVDGGPRERTGREAVKQWFELMLRQKPGGVPIYRLEGARQPGVSREVLGRHMPDGWVQAELERSIRDTASFCPAVRTVDSFVFTRLRRGLEVQFTVCLVNGDTEEIRTSIER